MGLTTVDRRSQPRSIAVDHDLGLLRRAVSDCGYTLDALEAAMGKGRAYISKVLNGEKPMSHEFEIALPNDVEACYRRLQAEHHGLIVVEPAEGDEAVKRLVSGLFGVLGMKARKTA
jgi:hypothetical protein